MDALDDAFPTSEGGRIGPSSGESAPTGAHRAPACDPPRRSVAAICCAAVPYRMVTSVCEHGSRLVLGSLLERGIAVCG